MATGTWCRCTGVVKGIRHGRWLPPLSARYSRLSRGWRPDAAQVYPYNGRFDRASKKIWEVGVYEKMRDQYLHAFQRATAGLRGPSPTALDTSMVVAGKTPRPNNAVTRLDRIAIHRCLLFALFITELDSQNIDQFLHRRRALLQSDAFFGSQSNLDHLFETFCAELARDADI